jgi:hypothetical protein
MGQRRLVEMALGKGADWSVAAEQIGRPEDAAVRNGNLDCASLVQVSNAERPVLLLPLLLMLKIPCPGRAVCVQEAERAYQVYKVRALAEQAAWGGLEAPLGRTRRATVKKHSHMAPIVCLIRRAAKRELPEVEVLGMTGQAASAAQGRKRSRRGCAEQRAAVVHHVAHGLNGDLFKELMGFLHGP